MQTNFVFRFLIIKNLPSKNSDHERQNLDTEYQKKMLYVNAKKSFYFEQEIA